MADREILRVATLIADLPGGDDDIVDLTITDPYGLVLLAAEVIAPSGWNRYRYTTLLPLVFAGLYTAEWHLLAADTTTTQVFSVGRQPTAGITKFLLRSQIGSRVSEVVRGTVSNAGINTLADLSLVGNPEQYNYYWIMLDPLHVDAGIPFRVVGYNGSAFELHRPFTTPPTYGAKYTMFQINPTEIDEAMQIAVNELSEQARIEVRIEDALVVDDLFTLPAGITHISEIWSNEDKLLPVDWHVRTGRRIAWEATPTEPVDLVGIRSATFPLWEDSIIESDPFTTSARAAFLLHANRAGGAAIDPEEHLRRQLAASDDYERGKRNSVGRIPPGSRPVLE